MVWGEEICWKTVIRKTGKRWKDNIMIDLREMGSKYGRWIDWDSPTYEAITISFQVLSKSLFRNHVTVQHSIILSYLDSKR